MTLAQALLIASGGSFGIVTRYFMLYPFFSYFCYRNMVMIPLLQAQDKLSRKKEGASLPEAPSESHYARELVDDGQFMTAHLVPAAGPDHVEPGGKS